MDADLGAPVSYEALDKGTPVYSSDGVEVGTVAHVLAVPEEDVFDGIVIADREGAHHHEHRFADADDVESIHEHAVTLKLGTSEAHRLPRPTANPAVMRDDPTVGSGSRVHEKLMRAWDLLSGNY